MKNILLIPVICAVLALTVHAQDVCPANQVCVPQATADRLFKAAQELIEAREVIAKMLAERGASDAALASANKVIEGWKQLNDINELRAAKYQQVIALYEQTIKLYAGLVENLEKRLSKPKSAWSRFVDVLKNAAILLAGVSLGRGL